MPKFSPVSSSWLPQDDLLLRNSIEAGASLEALAKGAVKFSRRFTFHELRDRWHSLLYDSDVSAQASPRMVELELSGSIPPSRFSRLYNSKGNEKVPEKRKHENLRAQFYVMRKKIRREFYCSPDPGFLDKPDLLIRNQLGHDYQKHVSLNNEDQCGDSMVGDCLANNLGLQETDIEILRQAFPETIRDMSTKNGVNNAGNGFRNRFHNLAEDNNSKITVRNDKRCGFSKDVHPHIRSGTGSSLKMKMEPKDGIHTLDGGSNAIGKCPGLSGTGPLQTPDGFGGKQHFSSPGSDGSASFHMMGYSSPLPRLPLWKAMEDVSAPDMPVDENNIEVPQGAVETLRLPDDSDCGEEAIAGYGDIRSTTEFIDPHSVSEVEFTDLSDSLLNFSNEDALLFMDVDGKDTMDKSCYDNLNSLLLGSPKEILGDDICKVEHKISFVSNSSPAAPSGPCSTPFVQGDQQSDRRVEVDKHSTSVLKSEPLICVLNTEDTEIPCNDDIFLLIHPGTSFAPSARRPITTDSTHPISSSANVRDGEQGLNLMKKGKDPASSFTRSKTVGAVVANPSSESVFGRPLVGSAAKSELPKTKPVVARPALPNKSIRDPYQSRSGHAAPVTTVAGVLEEDRTKVEPRAVGVPAIYSEWPLHEAEPVKLTIPESIANPSTSDQDECESDGDVPYFSDVEAMILDMDLAYDQDSCINRQVAKYQYEDTKRTIIRLEQSAHSSMQRAMTSKGAFAILYGRNLKHYIQKTEVTLGRSTNYNDIDIDLSKEGRANKISRLQATIKMEADGSFSLKNHGKNPICVNGKAIACGQEFAISSNSLIEIKGMSFMFEINDRYVRRYVKNLTKQSQGMNSNFEWSHEEEP